MSVRINLCKVLASLTVITGAGNTFAADSPKPECPTPTKEAREKMAAWHEQMAVCLRSDKAITQCHTEMAKSHREAMQEMGCPGGKMHSHADKNQRTSSHN